MKAYAAYIKPGRRYTWPRFAHVPFGSENADRGIVCVAVRGVREAKASEHEASLGAHAARLRKYRSRD